MVRKYLNLIDPKALGHFNLQAKTENTKGTSIFQINQINNNFMPCKIISKTDHPTVFKKCIFVLPENTPMMTDKWRRQHFDSIKDKCRNESYPS